MSTREAIRWLKSRIKELAAAQKKDKGSRKGCDVELQPRLWGTIFARSSEITASLNLYLALRGKPYRHNAPDEYLDKRYTRELNEKIGGVVAHS